MSDTTPSGGQPSVPDEIAASTPQVDPTGAPAPVGSFGSTRGSGLARGKRPSHPAAAPAAVSENTAYQPTTVEVIKSQSEYKNPFTGEQSTPAPTTPTPPPAAAKVEPKPEAAAVVPVVVKPAPVAEPPAAAEPAAELKILPPQEAKRPAQSWEAHSYPADSREKQAERPAFRPERPAGPREPQRDAQREPQRDAQREPQRDARRDPRFEQREPRPYPDKPRAEQPAKPVGFLAWLKGLFGGTPTSPARPAGAGERQEDEDYRRNRRRHRGGRGRQHGPRDGQSQGGSSQGGQPHGDRQGGERRFEGGQGERRHRGGRQRYRGERGDRGPNPGSEGHKGGGAI